MGVTNARIEEISKYTNNEPSHKIKLSYKTRLRDAFMLLYGTIGFALLSSFIKYTKMKKMREMLAVFW